MPLKDTYRFYLRIVLPSMLAMLLFIVSFFVFILPAFERQMLVRKKEMISELTNTAWSVIDEYQIKITNESLPSNIAKNEAAKIIELMRYGAERKDYFWIIDLHPRMIMHPYRPELNGTDLSEYKDPEGTMLFREAVELVKSDGEGYIQYIWQWKDDSTRLVPKLSYVKAYQQWNWIIGTGIYLDDVAKEISVLKNRLFYISLAIILIIICMLIYMVRQSLNIERARKTADAELRLSQQKYKSLVEASTEGTIMIIDQKIIFANIKFTKLLNRPDVDVHDLQFNDLFYIDWENVLALFTDPNKSVVIETKLKCGNQSIKDVVISVSKVKYGNDEGYIVVTKKMSRKKRLELGTADLNQDLQLSLLLMNQPIVSFIKDLNYCNADSTAQEVASLLASKKLDVVYVKLNNRIIGSVDAKDLTTRVMAMNLSPDTTASEIMTSPIFKIQNDALLYEALLLFKNEDIKHLLVTNLHNEIIGKLSYNDALGVQHNSVDFTIREIEAAQNTETLVHINSRTPVLIGALLKSGDKTINITHVITSISDAINKRLIELTIERLGKPPCDFAFIALGSEARREQTLATDQDNAIVFEDIENNKAENTFRYFTQLAKEVNTKLNKIGFKFCKGEVMAMNPKWTQPLKIWKKYFSDWIQNSDPQSILDSSIFFDIRCIYGKQEIAQDLVNHIYDQTDSKAVFFHHMANPILRFKSRVSMFGSIVGDEDSGEGKRIDIKKIQSPITTFARLYALKHKINETNTIKRLDQLLKINVLPPKMHHEMEIAYNILMQLRLRFQTESIINNETPNNFVDISKLTSIEVSTLKKVLSELTDLQTQVSFDFKGGV